MRGAYLGTDMLLGIVIVGLLAALALRTVGWDQTTGHLIRRDVVRVGGRCQVHAVYRYAVDGRLYEHEERGGLWGVDEDSARVAIRSLPAVATLRYNPDHPMEAVRLRGPVLAPAPVRGRRLG